MESYLTAGKQIQCLFWRRSSSCSLTLKIDIENFIDFS